MKQISAIFILWLQLLLVNYVSAQKGGRTKIFYLKPVRKFQKKILLSSIQQNILLISALASKSLLEKTILPYVSGLIRGYLVTK